MVRFFSPRSYGQGRVGGFLALVYLGLVALLVAAGTAEAAASSAIDGSFFFGFALMVTLPLSAAVMGVHSAVGASQGLPLAGQDTAGWMYLAFAACGVINALVIWVILRGRRIRRPVEPDLTPAPWV